MVRVSTIFASQLVSLASAQSIDPFPTDTAGVFFSGVFSDNAVLQRAPQTAAVHGVVIGAQAGTTVTVAVDGSLADGSKASYTTQAAVTLTAETVPGGGSYATWKVGSRQQRRQRGAQRLTRLT